VIIDAALRESEPQVLRRSGADSGHREHRDRRIVITPIGIMIGA